MPSGRDSEVKIVIRGDDESRAAFRSANDRLEGMRRNAARLRVAMVGLAAGLAAAATASVAMQRTLNALDEIGKTADAIGVTTDALQEYRFAAQLAGVSQGELESGLAAFTKRLGEARNGTGALATFLKKQDQALLDQLRNTRNAEEALELFFEALSSTADQSDRAALAAAGFGRTAGIAMTNLVREGSDSLKGMREEAQSLGLVLDEQLIRQAEQTNDAITRVGAVIKASGTRVMAEFADEVEDAATWLLRLYQDNAGNISALGSLLSDAFGVAVLSASYLVEQIELLTTGLATVGAAAAALATDNVSVADVLEASAEEINSIRARYEGYRRELEQTSQTVPQAVRRMVPPLRDLAAANDAAARSSGELVLEIRASETPLGRFEKRLRDVLPRLDEVTRKGFEIALLREQLQQLADQGVFDADQVRAYSQQLDTAERALRDLATGQEKAADTARDMGTAIGGAFEDAIVAGDDFRGILSGLVSDLLRLTIRQSVTAPLSGIFGDLFKGFFGSAHTGGVIGDLQGRRLVSPLAFAGAPRFHAGGVLGLGPDEVPIIGRVGEEVITRSDPRHRANGGGAVVLEQTVTIDARGADAGVESRIRAAMAETKAETIAALREQVGRGGALARDFGRRRG